MAWATCELPPADYLESELRGYAALTPICWKQESPAHSLFHPSPWTALFARAWIQPGGNRVRPAPYRNFPEECVAKAISTAVQPYSGLRYGVCDSSGLQVMTQVSGCSGKGSYLPPPAATPAYVQWVHQSYLDAMECLGLNPKEMYSLLAHESHFQVNAVSYRGNGGEERLYPGAWGVGQLTDIAIEQINQSKKIDELRHSPRCLSIAAALETPISVVAPEFRRSEFFGQSFCERSRLPLGPLKSFVYAGLTYLENKNAASQWVREHWKKSHIKKAQLDTERAALIREIAQMMYNGGIYGVRQVLDQHWETVDPQRLPSVNEFKKSLKESVMKHYDGGLDRRTEVSQYTQKLSREAAQIAGKLHGKCSW